VRLRACTYLGGVSRGCWGVASRPNEGDVVQDLLRNPFGNVDVTLLLKNPAYRYSDQT
jgi:hypothetical protein